MAEEPKKLSERDPNPNPIDGTEDIHVVVQGTPKLSFRDTLARVRDFVAAFILGASNTFTGALNTFNSIQADQLGTPVQNPTTTGSNPSAAIDLKNVSLIQIDLTSASGTATITFSSAQTGQSIWIQVTQHATVAVNVAITDLTRRYDTVVGNSVTGIAGQDYDLFLSYDGSTFSGQFMPIT